MFREIAKTVLLMISWALAKTLSLPQKPSILMYHSFDTEGWKYGVDPRDLEKQIAHLRSRYVFVTLTDVVAHVKGELVLPKNAVAVTIDDGYEDTYSVFFPLAQKYKIPFTLFLTTDLSEQPNLGNLPRPTTRMLQEMQGSELVTFGLHGHTHRHFDTVFAEERVKEEIELSETWLEKTVNDLPRFVAYPSGRYNEAVLRYFRTSEQYEAGLSIKSGFITPGDDTFLLRRIEVDRNIPNYLAFRLRLTPALTVYNKIIARIKT